MPWEYLLTAAIDPDVDGLVVRRIRGLPPSRQPSFGARITSAMYLECQAGALTDCFNTFNEERQLHAWMGEPRWYALPKREGSRQPSETGSPTVAEIRALAHGKQPRLIHVSGYDAKDAHGYLRQLGFAAVDPPERGLAVADAKAPGGVGYVDAKTAAQLLCAQKNPPDVVAFSVNRSAELALEAVRAGALASLGRDGEWDDAADATEQPPLSG
jgi:hypothetical protein